MTTNKPHVVVVTGLSGSGKSTAIKAFEDLDFFCIDNLPVPLLPDFLSLVEKDMPDIQKIALGIDIRERKFLKDYDSIFKALEKKGYRFEIIFLEAATEVLQKRFSQTRRVHPAGAATGEALLLDAIHNEREQLKALRGRATRVVDTGALSVHQLKALITRSYSMLVEKEMLSILVLSFGFKHGLPFEADMVMDVRFLPNPYFIDELKELDGCNSKVSSWVLQRESTQEFIREFSALLLKLLPRYVAEGKRYLTLALGCTGGKHRSVSIGNEIADRLAEQGYFVNVFHRDIHNE